MVFGNCERLEAHSERLDTRDATLEKEGTSLLDVAARILPRWRVIRDLPVRLMALFQRISWPPFIRLKVCQIIPRHMSAHASLTGAIKTRASHHKMFDQQVANEFDAG